MHTAQYQRAEEWRSDWLADPQVFAHKLPRLIQEKGDLDWLSAEVGARLLSAEKRVVTAESCTAGGIGAALTAIAGSSRWVEGGFITYSNAAKMKLLGVPQEQIETQGAVSQEVVESMAQGALRSLGAECSVAVSGVAGPGGGTLHKPVGTVWFAWAGVTGPHALHSQVLVFPGDRAAIRAATIVIALLGLLAVKPNPSINV